MENTIKVIYVQPDCIDRHDYDEWKEMSLDELYNEDGVELYSLDGFQSAFNFDEISDLGYIFFVEMKGE